MPQDGSIDALVKRLTRAVQAHWARLAAELSAEGPSVDGWRLSSRPSPSRRRPAGEMTRWVADRHARRVPKFVIEMTGGLDTKKKIVARYGANCAFEKGNPLPKARDGS